MSLGNMNVKRVSFMQTPQSNPQTQQGNFDFQTRIGSPTVLSKTTNMVFNDDFFKNKKLHEKRITELTFLSSKRKKASSEIKFRKLAPEIKMLSPLEKKS